jgi:leucyl aminopeptidase
MHPAFHSHPETAIPLVLATTKGLGPWTKDQPDRVKRLVDAAGFRAEAGRTLLLHDPDGGLERVLVGLGEGSDGFVLANLPASLPAGDYRLAEIPVGLDRETLALGWADGAYRFTRYKAGEKPRRLMMPDGVDGVDVHRQAEAIDWLRDLVNTPPCDMGPGEIAAEAERLAEEFGAAIDITQGAALAQGFPMVHAVGKGAAQAPRHIEMLWGRESDPKIAIVGKGVAFDTGGLNLKTTGYGRGRPCLGAVADDHERGIAGATDLLRASGRERDRAGRVPALGHIKIAQGTDRGGRGYRC